MYCIACSFTHDNLQLLLNSSTVFHAISKLKMMAQPMNLALQGDARMQVLSYTTPAEWRALRGTCCMVRDIVPIQCESCLAPPTRICNNCSKLICDKHSNREWLGNWYDQDTWFSQQWFTYYCGACYVGR